MLTKTLRCFAVLLCVLAVPFLFAQTPTPAPGANETMGTNPHPPKHSTHRASSGSTSRAFDYSTRLASLLADTQDKATLSAASWKAVANEANALANKLYASTSGKNRTAAKEARTHVRELHAAAMKGDSEGAKSHAGMALPYVYQIIDATAPAGMAHKHV
jgi:hypothetical protein